MEKPTRLAACEPCRQLKAACDHGRPVCLRCIRSGKGNCCVYRTRPFKKRRRETDVPGRLMLSLEQPPVERRYPNAGHLGLSSHAAIFSRLPVATDGQDESLNQPTPGTPGSVRLSNGSSNQQIHILEEILKTVDVESISRLIRFWQAKKVGLALGEPFVERCIQTLQQLVATDLIHGRSLAAVSQKMSDNSARPFHTPQASSISHLLDQISNDNVRWETIALALVAAGRATMDINFFPPLYTSRSELLAFQKSVAALSNKCLETAISLDCLNEIQLICQYENFILHSIVDGDQSYNTWRRLGDVISSLLYLGLNEKIEDNPSVPQYITELRRSVFAQIYSDDKNVAVFLGRPPRLSRRFCHFDIPGGSPPGRPMTNENYLFFGPNDRVEPLTCLRWAACCASLKEEILEALQESQPKACSQRLVAISTRAEGLWSSLPPHLKLSGGLRSYIELSSYERDFLLSIRLTYLQILFLVRNAGVSRESTESDDGLKLLEVSQEMLSLIVEAIVLKDHLVNSGSSLLWKVAHYGLPAAGAICLLMLRPAFWQTHSQIVSIPNIIQNLGTFASEVQIGGLLQAGDPNYALLHRATTTIQGLFRAAILSTGPIADLRKNGQADQNLQQPEVNPQMDLASFSLSGYIDLWGCEYDFWQDLGDHTSFLASEM